jgi:hypothetical protein
MNLISYVYPGDLLSQAAINPLTFHGRCLLTILNTIITELNTIIIGRLPGQIRTYQFIDS